MQTYKAIYNADNTFVIDIVGGPIVATRFVGVNFSTTYETGFSFTNTMFSKNILQDSTGE